MTDNFVTHDELQEAVENAKEELIHRIDETEDLLRKEFTGSLRYEMDRQDNHLQEQDTKLDRIQYWIIATLLTIVLAVIGLSSSNLHIHL